MTLVSYIYVLYALLPDRFTIKLLEVTTLKQILVFITMTLIVSCGGTRRYLAAGNLSKNETYKIVSYYGCCGCEAKYFEITTGKRKTEQVVYWYNCSGPGKPTKFVFNYDQSGHLISCDLYLATSINDSSIPLSASERQLFLLIDTSASMRLHNSVIKFSDITGFRKPYDKEPAHSFPLIKKGYKLPVH